MIIYIHGWGSAGIGSSKYKFLQKLFPEEKVVTGNFPIHNWVAAVSEIEILIDDSEDSVMFVGSSTGGLYAEYLANKYRSKYLSKALLINPIIDPEQLRPFLGGNENYKTADKFEFTEQLLGEFEIDRFDNDRLVLIDKGDRVLSYKLAAGHFPKDDVILYEGGSHRFEHLPESKDCITNLYYRIV